MAGFESVKKDGKEYCRMFFTVNSTNINVIDEVRRRLREFDSEYNFGRNTGTDYRIKDHKVDFEVDIYEDRDVEYLRKISDIFDDINNRIEELI